jgi:hypothetical protein
MSPLAIQPTLVLAATRTIAARLLTLSALVLAMPLLLAGGPGRAQDAASAVMADDVAPPTGWLGETPHLVLVGTVAGKRIAIAMPDMATAPGVATFAGKREYLIDGTGHRYIDFEVALEAVIDGIERKIELEFENHDFASHPLPADFALQTDEFPEGLRSTLEVETEWEHAGVSVNDEVGGWAGVLSLSLDRGTPDNTGLVPDGLIGGFATATNGAETLAISFTVPVAEYEVED